MPEHLAAAGFHTIGAKFDSTSKPFLNLVPTRFTIADARAKFSRSTVSNAWVIFNLSG
jgi:hypothetical protein